jgi:hypothetical protein
MAIIHVLVNEIAEIHIDRLFQRFYILVIGIVVKPFTRDYDVSNTVAIQEFPFGYISPAWLTSKELIDNKRGFLQGEIKHPKVIDDYRLCIQ